MLMFVITCGLYIADVGGENVVACRVLHCLN